jgi:hypothetical protein
VTAAIVQILVMVSLLVVARSKFAPVIAAWSAAVPGDDSRGL